MWLGQAADKDEKAKRWCRSISVPKQITRTRRIIQASSINKNFGAWAEV